LDNPYTVLFAFMVTTMVTYSIRLARLIYKQVRVDVFFLDWEKGSDVEGGRLPPPKLDKAHGGLVPHTNSGVSAWRTIFTANEWLILSTNRRCNVGITLVVLVALLEGGYLKYEASPIPDRFNLAAQGSLNRALLFANTQFWWWVIVGSQYVLLRFVWEHFISENPTARFVDLSTVMKISTLLMDQKYRGFYIHANAPFPYADNNLAAITRNLHTEACNARSGRGIPGCPDDHCQAFELHVPLDWRRTYDKVYRSLLEQTGAELDAAGVGKGSGGLVNTASSIPSRLSRAVERTRKLEEAHGFLSKFLKDFVEESDPQFKRVWQERDVAHAALGIPPDMQAIAAAEAAGRNLGGGLGARGIATSVSVGGNGLTHMYTDMHFRFENLVFRGIELDLLCFESLFLCIVNDALGGNTPVAAALTFLVSYTVSSVRSFLGKKSVSFTTLVDDAFINFR